MLTVPISPEFWKVPPPMAMILSIPVNVKSFVQFTNTFVAISLVSLRNAIPPYTSRVAPSR